MPNMSEIFNSDKYLDPVTEVGYWHDKRERKWGFTDGHWVSNHLVSGHFFRDPHVALARLWREKRSLLGSTAEYEPQVKHKHQGWSEWGSCPRLPNLASLLAYAANMQAENPDSQWRIVKLISKGPENEMVPYFVNQLARDLYGRGEECPPSYRAVGNHLGCPYQIASGDSYRGVTQLGYNALMAGKFDYVYVEVMEGKHQFQILPQGDGTRQVFLDNRKRFLEILKTRDGGDSAYHSPISATPQAKVEGEGYTSYTHSVPIEHVLDQKKGWSFGGWVNGELQQQNEELKKSTDSQIAANRLALEGFRERREKDAEKMASLGVERNELKKEVRDTKEDIDRHCQHITNLKKQKKELEDDREVAKEDSLTLINDLRYKLAKSQEGVGGLKREVERWRNRLNTANDTSREAEMLVEINRLKEWQSQPREKTNEAVREERRDCLLTIESLQKDLKKAKLDDKRRKSYCKLLVEGQIPKEYLDLYRKDSEMHYRLMVEADNGNRTTVFSTTSGSEFDSEIEKLRQNPPRFIVEGPGLKPYEVSLFGYPPPPSKDFKNPASANGPKGWNLIKWMIPTYIPYILMIALASVGALSLINYVGTNYPGTLEGIYQRDRERERQTVIQDITSELEFLPTQDLSKLRTRLEDQQRGLILVDDVENVDLEKLRVLVKELDEIVKASEVVGEVEAAREFHGPDHRSYHEVQVAYPHD